MERDPRRLGSLTISASSRRMIEAGIAANTSDAPVWMLHAFVFCLVGGLTIIAWAATAWAVVATAIATEPGLEIFGIPFFGFFAIVATIVWGAEMRFLRHALHASDEGPG